MVLSGGGGKGNGVTFPMRKPSKEACSRNRTALKTINNLATEKVGTYNAYQQQYVKNKCKTVKSKHCSEIKRNMKYHRGKAHKLLFAANNAVTSYNKDLKKFPQYCKGDPEKMYAI